jgi:hypothetical protein
MGWLWTGEGVYPWMYGVSRSAWLWYARQSSPRVFYDTATGQWFWPDVP